MIKNTSKVEKNRQKTGGRKKGTPNKRTKVLQEMIESEYPNFDPIISLISISLDKKTPLDIKVTCLKEISKYMHAQRKAIEFETENNTSLTIFVEDEKHKRMLEEL